MKYLPLPDAFRALLRTTHPERTDLQQIDSIQWFHRRRTVMKGGKLFHDQADAPAFDAYDLLIASVKSHKIKIRGMLEGANAQIEDIDPIYAREGQLDIFAGTLKVFAGKTSSRIARTYTGVDCYADDLPLPIGQAVDVCHRAEATAERNGSGVRMTTHATAEEACGAWIGSLPKQPRQKRNAVLEIARAKFSALSNNAFYRQWGLHAPAEWRRQGRFD
jgi:hypothetical protein